MSEAEKKGAGSARMGQMPVHRLFLTMSLPLIISMLVQAMYNVVDSIFVSQISEDALSAVSLVFPMQNLMIAVATGTGVGYNALISRRLGQKRGKEADDTANTAFFLLLCSYVVFLIIGILFSDRFMAVQNTSAVIAEYGAVYMRIVMCVSIGLFGQVTIERLLQSTGRTVLPMLTQITGAVINIIFDAVLIFGLGPFPEMGVAGAAAATVFGQCVACVMGLIFNKKYNTEIHLNLKEVFRPKKEIIAEIYKIGIPSIIMVSLTSVMTFGMNRILIGFTSTAVAVFGAYTKLQSIVFMPLFGMNNALVPIVSYNFGASKKDRIFQAYKVGCMYGCGFMWIGLLLFQLLPRQLLGFFQASEYMMEVGVPAMRIMSLIFVFAGISVISGSFFQAMGKSINSLIVSLVRQMIVLLPCAYLLSRMGELQLVWMSLPISELAGFAITVVLIVKLFRRLK
ncbi:MAG: MATE family efflux transporter [Eubacterium sp.]|nr:MATE family efflux transporter [Eubacterium sp.]